MTKLATKILLKFPPEWAHVFALGFFRFSQWLFFKVRRRQLAVSPFSVQLIQLPRLKFNSRLGLAAGFDKNADIFAGLFRLGFGFVEVGTVTPKPQAGNAKPRIWRHPQQILINHLGFNSAGMHVFKTNLERYRSCTRTLPLLANIGKNKLTPNERAVEDYEQVALYLKDCVDGFVVNVSSPNTPELRALQNPEFFKRLREKLPREVPIFIKLAPDLENSDLNDLLDVVREYFSGVVLTNTSVNLATKHFPGSRGGLSGPPLFDRALECVALARRVLGPQSIIIGVGGVSSKLHAVRMREAGADLVEIYTGFIYQGPRLVNDLNRVLSDRLL